MKTSGIKFIFLFAIMSCMGAIGLASDSSVYFGTTNETMLAAESDPEVQDQSFYNLVQEALPCPDFLKEEFGDVRVGVILRTTAEGQVLIEQILSDDNRLVRYIKSRLHGKVYKLKSSELNRVFRFAIRFKIV